MSSIRDEYRATLRSAWAEIRQAETPPPPPPLFSQNRTMVRRAKRNDTPYTPRSQLSRSLSPQWGGDHPPAWMSVAEHHYTNVVSVPSPYRTIATASARKVSAAQSSESALDAAAANSLMQLLLDLDPVVEGDTMAKRLAALETSVFDRVRPLGGTLESRVARVESSIGATPDSARTLRERIATLEDVLLRLEVLESVVSRHRHRPATPPQPEDVRPATPPQLKEFDRGPAATVSSIAPAVGATALASGIAMEPAIGGANDEQAISGRGGDDIVAEISQRQSFWGGKVRRARRPSMAGVTAHEHALEGDLMKQALFGTWQQRHFQMQTHYLCYKQTKMGSDFLGGVDLLGEASNIERKGNTLRITGLSADSHDEAGGERKMRTFILKACSKAASPSIDEWCEKLLAARDVLRGENVRRATPPQLNEFDRGPAATVSSIAPAVGTTAPASGIAMEPAILLLPGVNRQLPVGRPAPPVGRPPPPSGDVARSHYLEQVAGGSSVGGPILHPSLSF